MYSAHYGERRYGNAHIQQRTGTRLHVIISAQYCRLLGSAYLCTL